MASKASRKSPGGAKQPTGRSRVVPAAGPKAKPAKAAGRAAMTVVKPKVPSRPIPVPAAVAVVKGSASKANGSPASKTVSAKGAPPVIKSSAVKPKSHVMRRPEIPPPRPMPIFEAVPTNGKPRKNQAGLTSRELEHFRDLLLEKRRELVGDMYSMESEALRTSGGTNLSTLPIHMADMGTDNYEQEFTLGLVEKDRGLLREINSALAKIQNGTYGICEGTGKPITKPRLEAQPWARHSIEYARQTQRPMGMGRVG